MANATYRCQYCTELSIEALVNLALQELEGWTFPQHAYYQHHASFQDLEKSANNGCDLCSLMIECSKGYDADGFHWIDTNAKTNTFYIEARELDEPGVNVATDIKVAINSSQLMLGEPLELATVLDLLMVQVGPASLGWNEEDDCEIFGLEPLKLALYASKDRKEQSTIESLRIGRIEIEPDLGHDSNFSVAKNWLKTCEDTHSLCAHLGSSDPLPTRVIHVGTSTVRPRILLTNGLRASYAALSHCWGGDISIKLTMRTLTPFQARLPDELPANFEDAIAITRRLGIEYIWIDSLCIIQDSCEDWQQKAARMEAVYRHATVVIYAMSADKSTAGILHVATKPRTPMPRGAIKIHVDPSDRRSIRASIYDRDEETLLGLHISAPLSTRGWVLQELVLGPRRLIYSTEQIYWECLEGCQSARGDTRRQLDFFPVLQEYFSSNDKVDPKKVGTIEVHNKYYELASRFSRLRLTVASDKLPAIAGVVQQLHPVIGGQYVAGLWSNDLQRGLQWQAEMRMCPHTQTYRAPSWSWVCTDHSVIFNTREKSKPPSAYDMRLIEYKVTLVDERSLYSQITAASLTIDAFTIPLIRSKKQVGFRYADVLDVVGHCNYDATDPEIENHPHDYVQLRDQMMFIMNDEFRWFLVTISEWNMDDSRWTEFVEWTLEKETFSRQEYKATILEAEEPDEDGATRCGGLVLRVMDSESVGTFERVGQFDIHIPAEQIGSFQREVLKLV